MRQTAAKFLPRLQNDCQKQKLQEQTEKDGRFLSKLIKGHIVKIKLKRRRFEDIVKILSRITGGSGQHNKLGFPQTFQQLEGQWDFCVIYEGNCFQWNNTKL